jgi:oligopeptide transport system ATP-binding protein
VKKGEVFGIVGTNGSGKSTLLKMIAGVLTPTSGTVVTRGKIAPLIELGAGFDAELTGRENIYLNGAVLGYSEEFLDEQYDSIVEFSEIGDFINMPLKNYSSGMVSRIAFAIATAVEPDILIADEPTTALDVTIQAQILELIQDLQKKLGMAVILVTHDLGVIADMCDNIVVMYGGRFCERGTAAEIFYNPKHEYTKGLLRSIPTTGNMKKKLIPISGTPINMLNLPKGCAFCPRCDAAMKICLEAVPEEIDINENHRAACWMNIKEAALAGKEA